MNPLVLYHAHCADGFGAAFAAWLVFGDVAEYVPVQHGKTQAIPEAVTDRDIFILDFGFDEETTNQIFRLCRSVTLLDHHKTAFETWCDETPTDGFFWHVDPDVNMHVLLDNNKSGAVLAWDHFHPGTEVPLLIRHIDDYDRWQFRLEGTKAFNKALWAETPWNFRQWTGFLPERVVLSMRETGTALLRAHDKNVLSVVEGGARRCEIALPLEHRLGLAANCPPHLTSDVGHELANRSGTFGLCWHQDTTGAIRCSLRSNEHYDVSAIAKHFAGGGHRNAAGFSVSLEQLQSWMF